MPPSYKGYSLNELKDALAHIDQEQYPERTQMILDEIKSRTESPEAHSQQLTPTFEEDLHPNILIRYWRGQVSLPVSYWVVGITVSLVFIGLGKLFETWIESASSLTALGIYIILLYFVMITLLVWHYVGVYRSATFHPLRGGSKAWALIAKVMVFVGLITFSHHMYIIGTPVLNGAFESIIGGEQKFQETSFRILNDGKDLELMGGIEIGSELLLASQLQQNSDIERIHLHSIGGRVLAAKRMADIIREYKVDTYVKTQCASSCTLLYLAGQNKLLANGGELKFHAPSIGNVSGHKIKELSQELEKAYAEEGLPRWFIDKAINTPSDSLWIPTREELLKARVVDKFVEPSLYASSGLGKESEITIEQIESGLLTQDYMVAMKEYDHEAYLEAIDINYQGLKSGISSAAITDQFTDLLYVVRLPVYLASASDSAITEYWNVQIMQMKELQNEYPLACASFVYTEEVPADKRYGREGKLSSESKAFESKALAELIRSHKNEHIILENEAFQSLIEEVIIKVRDESEEYFNVIASAKDFVDQPSLMCEASIALNEAFYLLTLKQAVNF